jgi:hypothetical protein
MPTKIVLVIHEDGTNATAGEIWGRPSALLFEITEGQHKGKRGPDTEIFDLVGPISWDRSQFSIYENGEYLPAEMYPASL